MKSKKVLELMSWLNDNVRIIDIPRTFSNSEVEKLIEISEIELSGNFELLKEKTLEFKNIYGYNKPEKGYLYNY